MRIVFKHLNVVVCIENVNFDQQWIDIDLPSVQFFALDSLERLSFANTFVSQLFTHWKINKVTSLYTIDSDPNDHEMKTDSTTPIIADEYDLTILLTLTGKIGIFKTQQDYHVDNQVEVHSVNGNHYLQEICDYKCVFRQLCSVVDLPNNIIYNKPKICNLNNCCCKLASLNSQRSNYVPIILTQPGTDIIKCRFHDSNELHNVDVGTMSEKQLRAIGRSCDRFKQNELHFDSAALNVGNVTNFPEIFKVLINYSNLQVFQQHQMFATSGIIFIGRYASDQFANKYSSFNQSICKYKNEADDVPIDYFCGFLSNKMRVHDQASIFAVLTMGCIESDANARILLWDHRNSATLLPLTSRWVIDTDTNDCITFSNTNIDYYGLLQCMLRNDSSEQLPRYVFNFNLRNGLTTVLSILLLFDKAAATHNDLQFLRGSKAKDYAKECLRTDLIIDFVIKAIIAHSNLCKHKFILLIIVALAYENRFNINKFIFKLINYLENVSHHQHLPVFILVHPNYTISMKTGHQMLKRELCVIINQSSLPISTSNIYINAKKRCMQRVLV